MISSNYLKFKGILFDKDGTLIDQSSYLYQVIIESCKYLCLRFDRGQTVFTQLTNLAGVNTEANKSIDINKIIQFGLNNIYDLWFDILQIKKSLRQEVKKELKKILTKKHFVSNIANLQEFFSIFTKQDLIAGIATMDTTSNTNLFIKDNNIEDQVSFMACVDSGYGSKPTAGMVLAFCDKFNLRPETVIVVGDSYGDMMMAVKAGSGLKIGIDKSAKANDISSIKNSELHPLADYILASINEIPNLLKLPKN